LQVQQTMQELIKPTTLREHNTSLQPQQPESRFMTIIGTMVMKWSQSCTWVTDPTWPDPPAYGPNPTNHKF